MYQEPWEKKTVTNAKSSNVELCIYELSFLINKVCLVIHLILIDGRGLNFVIYFYQ